MQNELGTTGCRFSDPLINLLVLPLFDPVGFPFCKVAAHREWRVRHVDRIFFTLFVFVLFAGLVRRFVRHFYHTIWFTTEQTEDFTVSVCVSVNFYICVL